MLPPHRPRDLLDWISLDHRAGSGYMHGTYVTTRSVRTTQFSCVKATMAELASFQYQSFVRGHHVYLNSWTPVVGEQLVVRRELDNNHDQYAVAVIKDGEVVGHVPQAKSRLISFFLGYDGNVCFCEVTGARLNRGVGLGMEVPCVYKFYGRSAYVKKLKELLTD